MRSPAASASSAEGVSEKISGLTPSLRNHSRRFSVSAPRPARPTRRRVGSIVLVDTLGYWSAFEAMLKKVVAEGFAKPSLADLYSVVSDPAAAIGILQGAQAPAA